MSTNGRVCVVCGHDGTQKFSKCGHICVVCSHDGIQEFSRCGHILHQECFKYKKRYSYRLKCPRCEISRLLISEIDHVLFNIRASNLHISDAAELYFWLENLIEGDCRDYNKSRSYDTAILENLQRSGIKINTFISYTSILLYAACINDDLDKVNLLIDLGLDLKEIGEKGLEIACRDSSFDTFERLIQAGIKITHKALTHIINAGNVEMLNRALNLGADVNAVLDDFLSGERLIHAAARTAPEMIQILIENGADFNAIDNYGNSILHYMCFNYACKTQDVELLIESGFDFACQNNDKKTPLMIAIQRSNSSISKYLIQKKLGINFRDSEGNTPLHFAKRSCRSDITEILIREGADVDAKNKYGTTPLHLVDFEDKDEFEHHKLEGRCQNFRKRW
jgi:ankyrin repeat protein